MKSNVEFWERVNLALDERRDPLEDELVQDAIASDPQRLDELVRLQARLAALPLHREPRRIPRAAAAAMIVVALGAIALELVRAPRALVESNTQLANLPAASFAKSEVVDFELSITTERPGERETVVVDRTGTRSVREFVGAGLEGCTLTTEVSNSEGR